MNVLGLAGFCGILNIDKHSVQYGLLVAYLESNCELNLVLASPTTGKCVGRCGTVQIADDLWLGN